MTNRIVEFIENDMKNIGYDVENYECGIMTFINRYGDYIMIDLVKNEITKKSDYYRGWLKINEINVLNSILNLIEGDHDVQI